MAGNIQLSLARVATCFSVYGLLTSVAFASEPTEFNRDIRAILADHCFQCHGPDGAARKADLRLDLRDAAVSDLGGIRSFGSSWRILAISSDFAESPGTIGA